MKFAKISALVLSFFLLFSACAKKELVASVENEKIYKSEYSYYLDETKKQIIESYQKVISFDEEDFKEVEIEGRKLSEIIKEKTLEELINVKTQVLLAKEFSLSEDDKKAISDKISEITVSWGGEESFKEKLKQYSLSKKDFEKIVTDQLYVFKLKNEKLKSYTDEETAKNIKKIKYVFIKTVGENRTPLEPNILETALKMAKSVGDAARDGADFDSLIAEFNEDNKMSEEKNGILVSKGSSLYEQKLLNAALSLKPGDVSENIVTDDGIYIVKSFPLSLEDLNGALKEQYEKIKESVHLNMYQDFVSQSKAGLSITKNDEIINLVELN